MESAYGSHLSNEMRAQETTLLTRLQASQVVLSCPPMMTRTPLLFILFPHALDVQATYGAAPVQLQSRANCAEQQMQKVQYSSMVFSDWQGCHNAFKFASQAFDSAWQTSVGKANAGFCC